MGQAVKSVNDMSKSKFKMPKMLKIKQSSIKKMKEMDLPNVVSKTNKKGSSLSTVSKRHRKILKKKLNTF